MAADWNTPALTDTYTNFLLYLKDRDVDALKMLDGITATNLPTLAKRWNAASNRFESWNGTAWAALTAQYAIDVATVGGKIAANTANNLAVLDGSALVPLAQIPTTLTGKNADMVDGFHAGTANTANTAAVRDAASVLWATSFNSSAATDNLTATDYVYTSGDGQLRKKTLANTKAEIFGLRGASCRAGNGANLAIPTGVTTTELALSIESYDDAAFHSTTVNNARMTIPDGVTRVMVVANVEFAPNATGTRSVYIIKNTGPGGNPALSEPLVGIMAVTSAGATTLINCTGIIDVVGGDFLRVMAGQSSGANLDVISAHFSITALA